MLIQAHGKEMDIPGVTQDEVDLWVMKWEQGKNPPLIQDAFPQLTPSQREFILTGISDEDWDTMFGEAAEDVKGNESTDKILPEDDEAPAF